MIKGLFMEKYKIPEKKDDEGTLVVEETDKVLTKKEADEERDKNLTTEEWREQK